MFGKVFVRIVDPKSLKFRKTKKKPEIQTINSEDLNVI
jgi:hypothetical protein